MFLKILTQMPCCDNAKFEENAKKFHFPGILEIFTGIGKKIHTSNSKGPSSSGYFADVASRPGRQEILLLLQHGFGHKKRGENICWIA